MKRCRCCLQQKAAEEFFRQKKGDGRSGICKPCHAEKYGKPSRDRKRERERDARLAAQLTGSRGAMQMLVCWLEKPCKKCNVIRPLGEFVKRNNSPDGREKVCRDCRYGPVRKSYGTGLHGSRLRDRFTAACRNPGAAYSGSIEEYAEYRERLDMGCGHAGAWTEPKPKAKPVRPPRVRRFATYTERYQGDPAFRSRERIRRQFKKWLSGERSSKPSFLASVDYSWNELREHIERQFLRGMSWDNSDEWHIDHIVPKSTFDPSDPAAVAACWGLPNLRPIWASDNVRKNAKREFLL